jgi:ribosomal-protein-alanine N-acetyltransferase
MPDYRHQGVGQALVERALSTLTALQADECFLEVRTNNGPAIGLYRKLGFEVTRTIPRYYYDSSDALVMTKVFS